MKKQKNYESKKINSSTIVAVIFISAVFLMSVGFASFNSVMNLDGFVLIIPPENEGIVEILGYERTSNRNVNRTATPTQVNNVTLNFGNISYSGSGNTVYKVVLHNDSKHDWVYNGTKTTITKSSNQGTYTVAVSGITEGDILASEESVTLSVTMTANRAMRATAICEFQFEDTFKGALTAFIQVAHVDLTENNLGLVKFVVSSSYDDDRTFTITSSDSDFSFVDASGNELTTFTAHNGINKYEVYVKYNDNIEFLEPIHNIKVVIAPDGLSRIVTDSFEVTTPFNEGLVDELPPQIGPVYLSTITTTGKADIVWSRTDTGGSSVQGYTIRIYNSSNVLQQEIVTNDSSTMYTLTDSDVTLQNGDYYVVVFGRDSFNSGESSAASATTTTTNARRSETTNLTWTFTVSFSIGNYSYSGEETAARGSTYRAQITGNSRPNSITVGMSDDELTTDSSKSSYYTYDSSTGNIVVYNVQGNITITTETTCLVEGTKILIADGTYKNIEDITYNDLLVVWDFEHGEFTYEYPIWIEKKSVSKYFQLTTFDDGSTLKTVTYHGIYSNDLNKFVNIDNKDEFNIGTSVPKIVNNKGNLSFKNVKVKDIEKVNEKVNYYEIVTTTYYNVISDDFLTTDGNVELVNMYGFDDNIKWINKREENKFTYEELSDVLDYYLYMGLRAGEVKYFLNNGYIDSDDISVLKEKLTVINNNLLLKVPINEFDKRMWKVTTSEDYLCNKNDFLYEEGSVYTLPKVNNKNFIGFYNTADGKMYQSGDKYTVIYGTHFIARYSDK